ncbi:hypothetical protein [Pedobacter faecalis]|uniref:hypothetical protein n=1 Tax=Pedobacter faecalis TaxID=3041495 RepID=UPI00254B1E3F|nr:hypothetical protein [Pedobacter sp. ELA7]
MTTRLKLLTISLSLVVASCSNYREDHSILLESPGSPERYSSKLTNSLSSEDASEMTYVINSYFEEGGKKYVTVKVFGDGIRAEIPLLINKEESLAGVIRTKGVSYRGAELRGLQLAKVADPVAKFGIADVDWILD